MHRRQQPISQSVTIFVDADATPRDAVQTVDRLASEFGCSVCTVSSIHHEYDRPNHVTVDAAPQATDLEILRRLTGSDPAVVVTQDYGLAALSLAKGAHAVSPRGLLFTEDNIDLLLAERELHAHERKVQRRHRGPKPRTKDDTVRFATALRQVLTMLCSPC